MTRSLIVAMSENGVIGRDGQLPWHLSKDLRRFRTLTMGHHLIMGRRTFDSIGKPLPGRTTIVLTRNTDWRPATVDSGGGALSANLVLSASTLEEAWSLCGEDQEPFVIGGGEVYRLALPTVDRLYVTRVHATLEGDTYFPEINRDWRRTSSVLESADDRNAYSMTFETYERHGTPTAPETSDISTVRSDLTP